MPVIRHSEGVEYDTHGAVFTAYARPSTGSAHMAAWRLRIPAELAGVEHRISAEEIFLVLGGTPRISVDSAPAELAAGDVVLAPAGSLLRVDNPGAQEAELWVTADARLTGELADGTAFTPPWAR